MEKDVKRRDFLKTTTLAGMAAALPQTQLIAQNTGAVPKAPPAGGKRHLVFLNDSPDAHGKLIERIKSIKEFEFAVTPVKINAQQPQEIAKSIQPHDADVLLMVLPRATNPSGHLPALIGDLNVPIILLPINLDLIMLEADMVAAFRNRGTTAMLANSEAHAIELIKIAAAPRVLEGKKAVIYGKPFDSTSVPARNLSEDYVYQHTGVRLQYRPIAELKPLLASVDEAQAKREMERWKKEAVKVVEASDQAILDASRLYVLLRSVVDKEGLACISIDCLSFSFSANPILPYPCLSFTRLRDEGVSAACEADVCGSLSSMLLQEISGKPSYFCNVSAVDMEKSTTVLRHCVAPTKLMGPYAPALPYNLRDYHGMGRGVVPEVEFPVDVEVTLGGFSKDLKSFVLWPGRTQARVKDTERPSFENAPPAYAKMRRYCSNHVEVKLKDTDRFLHNIAGIHHVMVSGNYAKTIRDAMLRMNVDLIGPSDTVAP